MFLCSGLSSVFQVFVHSCGSFAVCIVLCQRVGIVVIALEVGHKEVSVLGFLIGLRLQRCLDGGKAGVRDRACGQADTAVSVVGCKDIFRDIVPAAVVGRDPVYTSAISKLRLCTACYEVH